MKNQSVTIEQVKTFLSKLCLSDKQNLFDEQLKASKAIAIHWSIEDVQEKAKEKGIRLSKKKAFEILENFKENHDGSAIQMWDDIEFHIDEYLES